MDREEVAKAYINSKMAEQYKFEEETLVQIESPQGSIRVQLQIDDSIGDGIVMMYVGWWKKHGNPNWVTKLGISDIGEQIAYNEAFVGIYK